jgi:hypothetical protein
LAQKQLEVCKPPLVRLTSNLWLKLFAIPSGGGGVGSIPHNVFLKMEKAEDLVEKLQMNKITYSKKLKIA